MEDFTVQLPDSSLTLNLTKNITSNAKAESSPCRVKSYLILIVFFIGIVVNGYLIWIIATVQQLRNLTNKLVANLALSNCLKCLLFLFTDLAQFVYHQIQDQFSTLAYLVRHYGVSYTHML